MSDKIMEWFFILGGVYFLVHAAVFLLRMNGVDVGGVHYGK